MRGDACADCALSSLLAHISRGLEALGTFILECITGPAGGTPLHAC